MKNVRRILAALLCVSLLMGMWVPVFAVGESNTLGVTFSVSLDTPEIDVSAEDQTIVMTLVASEPVTVGGIGFTVTWDEPLEFTAVVGGEKLGSYDSTATNYDNGKTCWQSPNLEDVANVTTLAIITFTVPANSPAGTYNVGVEDLELTTSYGVNIWESSASASTVLTINGPEGEEPDDPVADGYTASLNTLTPSVAVDDTVTVNVGVAHSADTEFAAGEVKVSYDADLLQFNESASTLGEATVKVENGEIILEDYGADKSFGTGVYVLVFTAIADGNAEVTLTEAAFINKLDAVDKDLIPATVTDGTVEVEISKKTYSVTLPDIFEGPAEVIDGESYTFTAKDDENYTYDNITATVDGNPVSITDNGNGTYTIDGVTGDLVITGTRTEKSYGVTFDGNAAEDITDGENSATYNTDYSFTLPSAQGWAYSVDSITIGGVAYTGYSVENSVYTIPGSAINGVIVITVSKIDTEASVTVEGTGAGAAAGYNPTANMNESYTLTITPEEGYDYTVSATVGGVEVVLIESENSYTIESVTGDVVFTVERIVVVDGVSVQTYITLDGTNMWLVLNKTTLASGKVATYNGEKMYWSEKYDAYCYLIVADNATIEDIKPLIGITDGIVSEVDYSMDVNKTGKVDASDAQLTYNMYNAVYNDFDADATIEKFLCADVNGDKTVNVEDATAIVGSILG